MLGEVELSQGGSSGQPLDVDITAPAKRLHDLYKTESAASCRPRWTTRCRSSGPATP